MPSSGCGSPQARAEEALVRTHVENALMFVETLAADVGYERALDIYVRELGVPDPLAGVIATRALVALGETLVPAAPPVTNDEGTADAVPLAETSPRRRRATSSRLARVAARPGYFFVVSAAAGFGASAVSESTICFMRSTETPFGSWMLPMKSVGVPDTPRSSPAFLLAWMRGRFFCESKHWA